MSHLGYERTSTAAAAVVEDTYRMRAVTHLDVDRSGVEEAAQALKAVLNE